MSSTRLMNKNDTQHKNAAWMLLRLKNDQIHDKNEWYFIVIPQWNSTFFTFSLITVGATEKVFKFKMPLKLFYNRNFVSIKQKCIFEHFRRVKNRKRSIKWHYLCYKTLVLFASSELPPICLCLHYIKTCCAILSVGIQPHCFQRPNF